MSPPGPPPPPAPSCASNGTVKAGLWIPNNPNMMYYDQPHTHETNGPHKCSYNKDRGILGNLKSNPGGGQYSAMVSRLCGFTENLTFRLPGNDGMCAEQGAAVDIAKAYCGQGANIITQTDVCNAAILPGKEGTYRALLSTYCTANNGNIKNSSHACSTIKTYNSALYDTIAKAFCEANPNDPFCSCYNVMNDKCANDSKTGVAGCSETGSYVDLRNATPTDFQNVWDGQRKCGSVCAGANKYIPANNQAGCKTTIQICAQEINVETATDSDIKAQCELNAEDGSSGGGGGGGGGGENVQIEELIIPKSLDDIKTFIPKGVDGLKTSRRQQTTVGVTSSIMSILMSLVVLIIIVSSGARRGIRR